MEWGILIAIAIGFFLWRQSKDKEKAEAATKTINQDTRLYQAIKAAKREYDWYMKDRKHEWHREGELLFENAHACVYHVEHFAEYRLGFYFKDLNEFGLYGIFVGNESDIYENYYRTDSTFKKEGFLYHEDD